MKNKLFYKKGVITGWLFIAIPTLLIFFFSFYPMIQAFLLSLQSGSGTGLTFSGLANYRRLFSDQTFLTATKNTLIFLGFQVPVMVLLAMFFSVQLNQKTLKLKGLFRTIIFCQQ